MFKLTCLLSIVGASAQRNPEMSDLERASDAYRQAGAAYMAASASANNAAQGASGGCVHDRHGGHCVSFLKGFLNPAVAQVMGSESENFELERKTQSPLVFMHMLPSSFLKDPVYPGAAAGAASTIASTLQSGNAAASTGANQESIMNQAKAQAAATLTRRVASKLNLDHLRKDAFIAVHLRTRRYLHNGGCPRSYVGCPVGFNENANGKCSPSASYNGPCGSFSGSSMSVSQKQDFAFKCAASWPCSSAASFLRAPDSTVKDGLFVTQPLRADSQLRLNVIEKNPNSFSSSVTSQNALWGMRAAFDRDLNALRSSFLQSRFVDIATRNAGTPTEAINFSIENGIPDTVGARRAAEAKRAEAAATAALARRRIAAESALDQMQSSAEQHRRLVADLMG